MEVQRNIECYINKVEEEEEEELRTVKEEIYLSSSFSSTGFETRRITKSQTKPEQIKYYRRPSTNIPFIPSLRILKRDIRRKYVEMISNVINSHDPTLFSSFIDEFYHHNCSSTHTFPNNAESFFRPHLLKGKESLKSFHTSTCHLLPDGVVRHSENQICKRLNESGSRIVGKVETTGTMIYLPKQINGMPIDNSYSIRDFLPALESPPPVINSSDELVEKFQISTQPMQFIMRANYEIVLDENHRFLSMNLYCYDMTFTPVFEVF